MQTERAAINMARRLVERHALKPPVDVLSLLTTRADVVFDSFPMTDCDGICIDLKASSRRPKVLINKDRPHVRQRFTLAHELGHVVIPWHVGTIVDVPDTDGSARYQQLIANDAREREANAFAAEILIPFHWLKEKLASESNLAVVNCEIAQSCDVSLQAACLRLCSELPQNYVYAVTQGGTVEYSGRSLGTNAQAPRFGSDIRLCDFSYAESCSVAQLTDRTTHWWKLPDRIFSSETNGRSSSDIHDEIFADIGHLFSEPQTIRQRIAGVVGAANSGIKRHDDYSIETLNSAITLRMRSRQDLYAFTSHSLFSAFVSSKSAEICNRSSK